MRCLETILLTLLIMVFASCQYDDQQYSATSGSHSSNNTFSDENGDDLSKLITSVSVCDGVPTYGSGGCVYWSPGSLNFGVVMLGQSKTLNVAIKTHPGIVDHYVEFICQHGFSLSDEINLIGDIPNGHVPGNRTYNIIVTFTPIHGTGIRTGSLWLQYYQWSPEGPPYQRWADELEITARVLNGGHGGDVIR